jgi:hypothetical protein
VGDQDSNPGSFDRGPNLTMDLRMVQYWSWAERRPRITTCSAVIVPLPFKIFRKFRSWESVFPLLNIPRSPFKSFLYFYFADEVNLETTTNHHTLSHAPPGGNTQHQNSLQPPTPQHSGTTASKSHATSQGGGSPKKRGRQTEKDIYNFIQDLDRER